MEQLLNVLPWLLALNAMSAVTATVLFALIGRHWVKRRTPQWLSGLGLYAHYFLDGLEYVLNRSALGLSMARSILVFKLMQKNMTSVKANINIKPPSPPVKPTLPMPTPVEAPTPTPTPAPTPTTPTETQTPSCTSETTGKEPGMRKRAKILPPGVAVPVVLSE